MTRTPTKSLESKIPIPIPEIKPAIVVSGARFAVPAQRFADGTLAWYDTDDLDMRTLILNQERKSLVWDGPSSLWVRVADELRAAGLLPEPPLSTTPYIEALRALSEEADGEYLPDYIQRMRAALAALDTKDPSPKNKEEVP